MLSDKKKKIALIVGAVVVVSLGALAVAGVDFGKFVAVNKNIVHNIAEGSHHIFMDDNISIEYIKNHTGCTKTIDPDELPQAFKPIRKYTHPPFIMGACQVCHAPKRSKPAAILTPTVQELCFECHVPVREPAEPINCNKCHNPHHAPKKHLLREKVRETECPVGAFKY